MKRRDFVFSSAATSLVLLTPRAAAAAAPPLPANVPPGDFGGPLGATLEFVGDPYAFLSTSRDTFGPIFKTKVLGRKIVIVSGGDAMTAFLDTQNVSRELAHPTHVVDLFGGVNMNMYDGDKHFALKSLALQGFNRAALTAYLPDLHTMVGAALGAWSAAGEVRVADEARRLSIEAICKNVMGIDRGERSDALLEDYARVAAGMISVPVALPGTRFRRARKARDRIFETFREVIADHRAQPKDDGLSRILAASMPDGRVFSDDEIILELHHMVIAGYIVFGLLMELLIRLDQQPAWRAALVAELDAAAVGVDASLEQLYALETMGRVVREAKRTAPILPLIFGTAARDFELGGYTVPKGWGVWMALSLSNTDTRHFRDPGAFDPDRYAAPRSEHQAHPHAWMPQGSGSETGHRCLGLDYSTLIAQVFLVRVLRGYDWEIPEQDMDYHWERLPAEPRDGLRVRFTPKA